MHREALQWIVDLLKEREVPFLICGGLAAIGYGSKRNLNDIDLFIPEKQFWEVVKAGGCHISKPAGHYREEGWDLEYVQFKHKGIKIEVGNADGVRIFNSKSQQWVSLDIDFSRSESGIVLGIEVPLMNKDDLISYKAVLGRSVDLLDIEAIRGNT